MAETGFRKESGSALVVLVLALVVVGLLSWIVISRLQQGSDPATEGLPGGAAPMDHSRQQRTMTDMRALGQALSAIYVASGAYPRSLDEIETGGYLAQVPATDAWGNPWRYEPSPQAFILTSLGSDGREGPAPPAPWTQGAYDCDLVMVNGQMAQAPSGR